MQASDYTKFLKLKEISVLQVFESIAKNGLEYYQGDWFKKDEYGKIVGACVLGQAAYNLQAVPSFDLIVNENNRSAAELFNIQTEIEDDADAMLKDEDGEYINDYFVDEVNEALAAFSGIYSLESQLNNLEEGLASKIIRYNDAKETKIVGGIYKDEYLHSWDEVVAYCKQQLEPFFGEIITLVDWNPTSY